MAHAEWCGRYRCSSCHVHECPIDLSMPCSPSCKGLHGYKINLNYCINSGCLDNLMYMFYGDEADELDYMSDWNKSRLLLKDFADEKGYANYPYRCPQ